MSFLHGYSPYLTVLTIIARRGNLPISMVLRSEGSLKLEMLSLARTSKYVDSTIVLSINKTEETAKTERTNQIR